jgi:curved DNA-binding protein
VEQFVQYKDYYKVMGVERGASQDEIKRAYRKLARKYHPDVSKQADAESRFKELGEAYAVLRDPEKRAAYDELGSNWQSGQEFKPPPEWAEGFEFSGGGQEGADAAAFSDFFDTLFGRRAAAGSGAGERRGFRARGEDHHAKVLIDLADTYSGATNTIRLRTPELDDTGHVVTKDRTLSVKIPKGVRQGQKIRLPGQGSPGHGGGSAGDLYLDIDFKPHRYYKPVGSDVYLDLPVTPWEAALGTTVKVPTPAGAVDLKIPAGARNGQKLRLKSRGIPGKPPGDFYVTIGITLPPADKPAARELYEKMQQTMPYNPRSHLEE